MKNLIVLLIGSLVSLNAFSANLNVVCELNYSLNDPSSAEKSVFTSSPTFKVESRPIEVSLNGYKVRAELVPMCPAGNGGCEASASQLTLTLEKGEAYSHTSVDFKHSERYSRAHLSLGNRLDSDISESAFVNCGTEPQ